MRKRGSKRGGRTLEATKEAQQAELAVLGRDNRFQG